MNFKIAKKEFLDTLSLSVKAISSTTPLPALSGILFLLTEESLTLVSSDSNISIRTSINNNDTNTLVISDPGEIVIDARYILEIVRKIDSDFIKVEIIDGTLVQISGGNSEFKINCMSASDYPSISFDVRDPQPFKLSTSLFEQIINEVSFACSDKETRPVLTGVNLKARNHQLFVSATDSYRMAAKTFNIDTDLNFDITVPAKYLTEICRSIINEDEVTIALDQQKISFIFNNTIIDTRLLDDEFPDTLKLIPTSFSRKLVVSSKEMINAIDRTLFIKADGKNTIKMNINSERIELTSSNQSGMSSFEQIKVISFEGDPLEISCSGKYMQDALKSLGSETALISFGGELRPMVVSRENDNSLVQLISPVRTYR